LRRFDFSWQRTNSEQQQLDATTKADGSQANAIVAAAADATTKQMQRNQYVAAADATWRG
jgi:hypothetical protein